jgi:hypothetical protein
MDRDIITTAASTEARFMVEAEMDRYLNEAAD